MHNNTLEIFCLALQLDAPCFSWKEFCRFPEPLRNALVHEGLLKEGQPTQYVVCEICEDYAGEVRPLNCADGQRRFLSYCPECGSDEIHPNRMRQWFPDYDMVAQWVAQRMECRGTPESVIPQKLWNVGRAAIAGQSRPIWLARTLEDEIKHCLPTGKQSILLVIVPNYDRSKLNDPDRTFSICELTYLESGQLRFDAEAVHSQIESVTATAEPTTSPSRKDTKRASAMQAAKKELHEHILSMRSLLANTDDELPRLTQKQLGQHIGESKVMVSRMLKEPDELLQILWRTANDPDMIRRYDRKAG